MKVDIVIMENYEAIRQREQDPQMAEAAPIEPVYYHTEYNFRITHLNNYTLDGRNDPPLIVASIGNEVRNIVHTAKIQEAFDYELNHR